MVQGESESGFSLSSLERQGAIACSFEVKVVDDPCAKADSVAPSQRYPPTRHHMRTLPSEENQV